MTPLNFLRLLFAGGRASGYVEFRFLKGGTRQFMNWPTHEHHPDLFTPDKAPAGKDVYFGVALRNDQTDGKAQNCKKSRTVWADVDLVDHPEFTDGLSKAGLLEATPDELTEMKTGLLAHILNVCAEHDIQVRCVVDSGHGLQVYAVLPLAVEHAETERFNKALALLLGADQKSTDIARILRVPGTQNLKNPARPLPVQVVYEDEQATTEKAAFEALPLPEKPKPEPVAPVSYEPDFKSFDPAAEERHWNLHQRYARSALQRECQKVAATGEGGRNQALNDAAFVLGTLVGAGVLDEVEARQELTHAGQACGLDMDEIQTTLHSGLSAGKAKPRDLSRVGQQQAGAYGTFGKSGGQVDSAPPSVAQVLENLPEKPGLANYRDLVLAEFAESGAVYRYHQIWRNWWRYDGGVYVEVPDEVMAQRVDLTLQAHGYTVKNAQITEILVKIGRDPMIGSSQTDQEAWELNTRSGILDLATGELYGHTPGYYSIIQSAAVYEPFVVSHLWLKFLREAVPDEADRELLQMFAGLCLTGDTSPQRALLLVGDGGTGKSTFVRVLQAVLGNLATSSALENIKDGSFLVGTLVGKRMCVVSELQRNVDWLPFKRVTGEDQISIDVKNKTPYTAKLDLKLIILSNVMPFLGDDTSNSSLMRRFLPVAFNVKPTEPDPTLEARLTHEEELPGVLNWMLDGLRLLQERGMRFPASDASALAKEIVEESNRVVSFLRECCEYVPEATVPTADLYDEYRKWCGRTGHGALNTNNFAKQLQAAGRYFGKPIEKGRTKTTRYFSNLMISTTPGGWDEDEG